RPQGNEGDLAISFPAALEYYRHRARPWELQMLIKARASVGDSTATRNLLLALAPQIYPPATHAPTPEQFAAIEAVVFARQEITRQLRRAPRIGASASDHSLQWNVKLTPGGIRDIEFLTQCLQRLHGGADTWLSGPATASTLVALQRLHDKGYLSGHDFHCLADAYQFLRLVEHRLQLRDGLQRHTVPDSPAGLDRLGRRCGMEGANTGEQLKHHIAQHFAEVRSLYERIIGPRKESGAAVDMEHLFEAPASPGLLPPALRRRFPITFAAAQEAAQLNASARRGLQRLLDAASMEPELMAELESNPTWLAQAAVLFSRSDFAVDHFSRHPKEIAALSEKSESDATSVEQNADQTLEGAIADLRRSFQRQQTRIMVQGLLGKRKPFETFSELSSLAGEALRVSFDLALANVIGDSDAPRPSIAVLALGRLGTQEFDFASDVDLVFVVPGDTSKTHSSVEVARKVVERFVHIVSSHTRDGILFPVDTRLRPLGNEGELVQSSAYLLEYLKTQAHPWEAATYLKARPIAGDLNSGASLVLDIHRTMLDRWRGLEQLAQFSKALAELRTKMEREGTGPKARTEFKHLPGGYYDIEYILAARCFQAAAKEPSPPNLAVNTVEQISALQAINALDAQNAESLRSAANLYRAVDHAHRLITGSGINHDPEPNLARRICVLLDLWGIPLPDGLHAALIAARANCREIYHSIFKSP
ncbi:MAG: hypothetical protein HY046_00555, partial [Acidobacteria bacterium]|nr:hypothetical protein [Acidobacteriota bacterium]